MSSKRKSVPGKLQNEVLLKSRRRCALCYAFLGDSQPKQGQIVRLSASDAQMSAQDLVYLCLEHHDEFDRGHMPAELVASKRDQLYQAIAAEVEPEDIRRTVLLVHGHDMEKADLLDRFLYQSGLVPIRFADRPSFGRSIIEKFESLESVGCAVILLTAEEVGGIPEDLRPRARQNVLFDLGYLLGRLGRKRVIVIAEPKIEIPSDLLGVYYLELDKEGEWQFRLASNLESLGMEVKPRWAD